MHKNYTQNYIYKNVQVVKIIHEEGRLTFVIGYGDRENEKLQIREGNSWYRGA